ELLQIKGQTDAQTSVTGRTDAVSSVKGHTDAVSGVAVMPGGARIVTGSGDAPAGLWGLGPFPAPPAQYQFSPPETRQALVDHAKAVVPRCLTIEQRKTFVLVPSPPDWCIDMSKYPYDAKRWKAWKAGKTADAVDSTTAEGYGDFADE